MGDQPTAADLRRPVYVRHVLPRCPRCGSTRIVGNHTSKWPGGLSLRHSRCQTCGQRINVVRE